MRFLFGQFDDVTCARLQGRRLTKKEDEETEGGEKKRRGGTKYFRRSNKTQAIQGPSWNRCPRPGLPPLSISVDLRLASPRIKIFVLIAAPLRKLRGLHATRETQTAATDEAEEKAKERERELHLDASTLSRGIDEVFPFSFFLFLHTSETERERERARFAAVPSICRKWVNVVREQREAQSRV